MVAATPSDSLRSMYDLRDGGVAAIDFTQSPLPVVIKAPGSRYMDMDWEASTERSANDDVETLGDSLSLTLELQGNKLKLRTLMCRPRSILLDRCAASYVQVQEAHFGPS